MTTTATAGQQRETVTCLEGGRRHAWESLGLDVIRDELRSVKRCVWCQLERTSKPNLRLR